MLAHASLSCTAFLDSRQLAAGALAEVVAEIKTAHARGQTGEVLIFDDASGNTVEVDLRGTPRDALQRLPAAAQSQDEAAPLPRGAGRPRLGVVAREVTLLPRHWEWLSAQSGGASVALRKLVEAAAKAQEPKERIKRAQEACYRFMSAAAGNQPQFEEATRALFANQAGRFSECLADWPEDLRRYAEKLAAPAFAV